MLKAQYAILAEFQREGTINKWDLLGTFDRVFTLDVPSQHPHMVFVALLIAENEDDFGKAPFTFKCLRPSGEPLFEQKGTIDIKPTAGSWLAAGRLGFQMNGLPLPEFGKYLFVLEVKGVTVATHPLSVVKQAPPTN
jgi:hypothetical protein